MDYEYGPSFAQVLNAIERAEVWQLDCAAMDARTFAEQLRLTLGQDVFQLPNQVVEQLVHRTA